jgi:hypothetical protein
LVERCERLGGVAAVAGPGSALVDWLIAECAVAGVSVDLDTEYDGTSAAGCVVIQATGGQAGTRTYSVDPTAVVLDVAELRAGRVSLPGEGPVVVFDPIGGPIGVAIAEQLASRAVLITQDNIAGNELSRTGDLAPANVRLAQAAVQIERRTLLRGATVDHVIVEDKYTGEQRHIECAAVVDCGFRLPTDPIPGAHIAAGDCVAPRTIYEAVLEGRRAALAVDRL